MRFTSFLGKHLLVSAGLFVLAAAIPSHSQFWADVANGGNYYYSTYDFSSTGNSLKPALMNGDQKYFTFSISNDGVGRCYEMRTMDLLHPNVDTRIWYASTPTSFASLDDDGGATNGVGNAPNGRSSKGHIWIERNTNGNAFQLRIATYSSGYNNSTFALLFNLLPGLTSSQCVASVPSIAVYQNNVNGINTN